MNPVSMAALILLLWAGLPTFASTLQPLSEFNTTSMRGFLAKTEALLPSQVLKSIEKYEIGFKDMGPLPSSLCSNHVNYQDLSKKALLKFRKRIYLHQGLWSYLKGDKKEPLCHNQSAHELAAKSLIFQIAKIYDKSDLPWDQPADRVHFAQCRRQYDGAPQTINLSPVCKYYLNNEQRISGSPSYKNLSDFPGEGQNYDSKNNLGLRSMNVHEMSSPENHFAYNFTQFLTDPTYSCRKPAFQTYFQKVVGFTKFASSTCQPVTHLYTTTGSWKIDIDPAKVYEVHFLFASKGEEMMSRWGHSMLRLVVCAPTRTSVGPDCLADIAYHVVLSYRANVDDVIVNYWDGLVGKYPSQLMTFAMPEIIDEYTRGQWRDLISLPLKLSQAEKTLLVQSALEHYWSYAGDYKFFSNNCASESDQLLRSALPKTHSYQDTSAVSPLKMYRNLSGHRLIDPSLLKDKKSAQRQGYFFPSQKESLDKAFEHMKPRFMEYQNLTGWARNSRASERAKVYETLESFSDIGHAYLLEKYTYLVQQNLQGRLMGRLLQGETRDPEFARAIEAITEASRNRLPWNLTQKGYGVPLPAELVSDEVVGRRLQDGIKGGSAYKELILKKFPDIDRELIEIKSNLELLTNRRRF